MHTNFFVDTLTAQEGAPIVATFKDGTSAQYTSNIFNLLKSDSTIKHITSATTGELLYISENQNGRRKPSTVQQRTTKIII